MFSPPSIVKNSILEESTSLHSLISTENTPEPSKYEEMDIENVISERTKVQHRSTLPTNPLPNPYQYESTQMFKEVKPYEDLEMKPYADLERKPYTDLDEKPYTGLEDKPYSDLEVKPYEDLDNRYDNLEKRYENMENRYENPEVKYEHFKEIRPNYENTNVFKDITNLESPRTFARLNAERLRTINNLNDLSCDNLIAPKDVLANALADHIYKVTNQKPSTSKIDEVLTNKMKGNDFQKENQWWGDRDTGQEIFPNEYFTYNNLNM